ncbi:hypothetical protein [Deinococcus sonorensis]|uniref:DUF3618 domain-containing protein n=2 Tax=Deinococcus sonorensis TaxID=309891 RepID=A0AAU7U966_9DEIO
MSERDDARERLRRSVDELTQAASLQVNMQKEPLKMMGGATGVGLALGVLVGRQFRRSRRIYVDAASPPKEQKALVKAQMKQAGKGKSVGNALIATVATLGFRLLQERVIAPRLEEFANQLMDQADKGKGSATSGRPAQVSLSKPVQTEVVRTNPDAPDPRRM